jgi:aminotransferase
MSIEPRLRPPAAARPTADFLSDTVRSMPPSGIRRFFDMLAEMKDVISLTIGEPDFTTPEPITEAAIASLQAGETHYTANGGILELRELIAANLSHRYGVAYDPRTELVVTVGASEAVDASLRALLDPGDEVIYHEPCFVSYAPCIQLAGGVPVPISTTDATDFRLRAADVEAAVTPRTKALFLGYPNNPTGAVLSRDELEAIAEVARRHDLLVVSDEIYDRLVYGSHRHVAASALDGMRERTVLIGGFSKAYAMTGWRLGWVCAPNILVDAMMKVHQYVMMSAPTPAQFAALEAMVSGEEDVRGMVAEYDRRRKLVVGALREMGLECAEPRGAFYAFPRIGSTGMNDETFAERLLMEERVAVIPGSAFGEAGAGHVRICYAQSYELLEEAMGRMRNFVSRNSPAA